MSEMTNEELLDSLLIPLIGGANANQPMLLELRYAVLARMTTGWRLIDDDARKAARVLLYIPAYAQGEPVRLGAWAEGERWWRTTSGPCPDDAQPTMWQPLPEPPR